MSAHEHQHGNCHCHPHGTAILEGGAIETRLQECAGWQLKDGHLAKTYRFPDADAALAFFGRVGSTALQSVVSNGIPSILTARLPGSGLDVGAGGVRPEAAEVRGPTPPSGGHARMDLIAATMSSLEGMVARSRLSL